MPQPIQTEIAELKAKIDEAKVKLGVQKENRTRLLSNLRRFKITTVEQAQAKAAELKQEADRLDAEATTLLSRARKLLERFE